MLFCFSKALDIVFANFFSHNKPMNTHTRMSASNKCPLNHGYYFAFINFYYMEFSPGLLDEAAKS